MLRIPSTLDDETERCVSQLIDAGVAVHVGLGPGFREPLYHNALCLELEARHLSFEREKTIFVKYRDRLVGIHRLDLVVCGKVVVELKAVRGFDPVHQAQVIAYLKASGLRVGLLMNFAGSTLKEGLKRFVL